MINKKDRLRALRIQLQRKAEAQANFVCLHHVLGTVNHSVPSLFGGGATCRGLSGLWVDAPFASASGKALCKGQWKRKHFLQQGEPSGSQMVCIIMIC